jgi:hypothetical protein
METMKTEAPVVAVKKKNIQLLIDYLLENNLEFTVKQRNAGSEEWKLEMQVQDVKKAILLGMFLKEAKLELYGHAYSSPLKEAREQRKTEVQPKEVHNKTPEIPVSEAQDAEGMFTFESGALAL